MLSVSDDDYLYFVERAVRGMASIVAELGDDRACIKLDANTPYGLLTHCLGVIEYWGGRLVAGRDVERDRQSEFVATGTVEALHKRVDEVLAQFAHDVATHTSGDELRHQPADWSQGPQRPLAQGTALLHVYEELAQHHGQLEIMRDAIKKENPDPFDPPMTWLRQKQGVKWLRPGPELIPAWVADMDFPVAPPIRAAITGMLDRGDLGYPEVPNPIIDAFVQRMTKHDWTAEREHVRIVSDLIQAVQIILDLGTNPDDKILAHMPNYPPFPAAVATMGRTLVPIPMQPDNDTWTWDHDAMQREAANNAKVLLIVNPHNPTGRAFTRPELQKLADLAEQHDLIVISDEIHAELVHDPHVHIPFASLSPQTAKRTVTVTSATKAYNIAGLKTAVAHIGPDGLRAKWDAQPPDLYGTPSTIGVEATIAAWRDCDDWLADLREHLHSQRDHLANRVEKLRGISMRLPDAGYLAWLDCRKAELGKDPADFFREHAGIELAPGPYYDPKAVGWVRLNFANSRAVLDEILDRMESALR